MRDYVFLASSKGRQLKYGHLASKVLIREFKYSLFRKNGI